MARRPRADSHAAAIATPPEIAEVYIKAMRGQRSGDIDTANVAATIKNVSATTRITDYFFTLYVPRTCLTHTSSRYVGEVSPVPGSKHRAFRRDSGDPGNPVRMIFPGEEKTLFSIDLGVAQLLMTNTVLAGDYEGTLQDKVILEVVVEGKQFKSERTVASIFADAGLL